MVYDCPDIWCKYAKKKKEMEELRTRKRMEHEEKLANETPCKNCGKKPSNLVEIPEFSDRFPWALGGFKARLCEECQSKLNDKYFTDYDD